MRAKTPRIETASSRQKRIEKANQSWINRDSTKKPAHYHPWRTDDKQIRSRKTMEELEGQREDDI